MFVKLLTVDLFIPGCSSLKDKRMVMSSLKARLRRKFNVSVAEVDYHNKWQRSQLAIVTVGVDRATVDAGCEMAARFIEYERRVEITDIYQEYF